jgi:photosystem II stability/assembly factor-like uncharacterized protein
MDSDARAQTWTAVGPPGSPSITALLVDPVSPTTVYAGTLAEGVFVTTDAGATWSHINTGLTSLSVTSFATFQPPTPAVPPLLYAGTKGGGVFRSSDRGLSWVAANNGLTNLSGGTFVVAPSTGTVYAGTNGGGVFKSTDSGENWVPANNGLTNQKIIRLSVDPSNPSTLLASTVGALFGGSLCRTVDGGANWSPVLQQVEVRTIAWDAFFVGTVYVGYRNDSPARLYGGLLRGTNSGEYWSRADGGIQGRIINTIAADPTRPGRVYAGAEYGLFVTSDFGASWSSAPSDGLPVPTAYALVFAPTSPPAAYLATAGIYRAVLKGNCATDGANLCLVASRFVASAYWYPNILGSAGIAVPLTSNTGAFWFFTADNLELVVKVLDGRSINGKFWVFYGSLTNVEFTLTVTDTQTGAVKTYMNQQGQLASVADTGAF